MPKDIYWDSSGRGYWYISFTKSMGWQRRKRVAGSEASMSDFHRIIESQSRIVRDTFNFMASKYWVFKKIKIWVFVDSYGNCLSLQVMWYRSVGSN